ncbi:MAG: histidine kinase [Acidobacteria bacterium]|nr:histidine kinase [Acidobacteriota bacterium]
MTAPNPNLRYLRFWPLQLSGWGIYIAVNVLCSLPWWRRIDYDAFRGAFLLSSFLSSFLMYGLCHVLWRRKLALAVSAFICMVTAFPLGMLCAASSFEAALHFSHVRPPFRWVDIITATPSGWYALMSWVAFYFGIKHYLALEENQRRLIATEILAKEAQLRALRYQLQPHFLFNTMNAISTLVLRNEPHAATEMIGKLASLLRSTLDAPDLHQIPLSDELAVTEEYLAIEAIRFGDRLVVRWDIDPLVSHALVPRLILQPLVENAVQHGIARRPQGGFILISTQRHQNHLSVVIENEPPEESAALLLEGVPRMGGVGLQNVRERLQQMYGADSTMHTTINARGNYEVSFTLPISSSIAIGESPLLSHQTIRTEFL